MMNDMFSRMRVAPNQQAVRRKSHSFMFCRNSTPTNDEKVSTSDERFASSASIALSESFLSSPEDAFVSADSASFSPSSHPTMVLDDAALEALIDKSVTNAKAAFEASVNANLGQRLDRATTSMEEVVRHVKKIETNQNAVKEKINEVVGKMNVLISASSGLLVESRELWFKRLQDQTFGRFHTVLVFPSPTPAAGKTPLNKDNLSRFLREKFPSNEEFEAIKVFNQEDKFLRCQVVHLVSMEARKIAGKIMKTKEAMKERFDAWPTRDRPKEVRDVEKFIKGQLREAKAGTAYANVAHYFQDALVYVGGIPLFPVYLVPLSGPVSQGFFAGLKSFLAGPPIDPKLLTEQQAAKGILYADAVRAMAASRGIPDFAENLIFAEDSEQECDNVMEASGMA